LIYPSDLQRLNKPGDIGHSIIVTFGNYPLKTYFSPSFKVPFYKIGKMDTSELSERFFDENEVFYSADKRNKTVFGEMDKSKKEQSESSDEKETDDNETHDDETDNEETDGVMETAEAGLENTSENHKQQDDDKNELLNLFEEFKENNPDGTLSDFYVYLADKIKQGGRNDE
jgi:hypothetical protein